MIFDVIERVPEIRNIEEPIFRFTCRISIQFNNISFKYPTAPAENRPVLENATFAIKAGQTTAIVGPSGSGKSTIVQLL